METNVPPLVIVLGVSIIVLELLLGVAVGPSGLDWAAADGLVPALASVGMGFLFISRGLAAFKKHGWPGQQDWP